MGKKYILALDSGSVRVRAVIFNLQGELIAYAEKELNTFRPQPDWREQDPDEIWSKQMEVVEKALLLAGIHREELLTVAVTNQRETTIVWNRQTGRPVYPAISWMSRQSESVCERLRAEGCQEEIHQKTSLVLNPYFSGPKLRWILDHVEGAQEAAERGELCFGTVDTWLMWKLSGGKIFATDYSNASRTMLFHLRKLKWDDAILRMLNIPRCMLPEVHPSSYVYGKTSAAILGVSVPIAACIGNQQADLFGQACFERGEAKNTYGEGSFFLLNTGDKPVSSQNGLVTTIAWGIGDKVTYALEGGSLVSSSSIEWLNKKMGILTSVADSEWVAKSVKDTDGVYFIPSFRGLSAPYWDVKTTGMIIGLKEETTKAHIVRAALEALAYQTRDVYEAVHVDFDSPIRTLKVDGGASKNAFLMQFQADVLGMPIFLADISDTTGLGAAELAMLALGVYDNVDQLRDLWQEGRRYLPQMPENKREALYDGWQEAIAKVLCLSE